MAETPPQQLLDKALSLQIDKKVKEELSAKGVGKGKDKQGSKNGFAPHQEWGLGKSTDKATTLQS